MECDEIVILDNETVCWSFGGESCHDVLDYAAIAALFPNGFPDWDHVRYNTVKRVS